MPLCDVETKEYTPGSCCCIICKYSHFSVKRTHVIDDESDYFTTDTGTWLTHSEKAALQKREEELRSVRHGSRRDRKITFDFAGRRIVENTDTVDMYDVNDEVIQQVHYGTGRTEGDAGAAFAKDDFCDLVNPNIMTEPPKVSVTECPRVVSN